jgi:hypothetical protein
MNYVGILTIGHTVLSLVALVSGAVVVFSLFSKGSGKELLQTFLITAAATSVTGFFFPFHGMTPAIYVGILACIILALVVAAKPRVAGSRLWSIVYAGGLVASEYLLVFVTIAQAFTKIPALHAAAPTLQESPFKLSQGVALVALVFIGVVSVRRFGRSRPLSAM